MNISFNVSVLKLTFWVSFVVVLSCNYKAELHHDKFSTTKEVK